MTRRPRSADSAAREVASSRAAAAHAGERATADARDEGIWSWWSSHPDVRVCSAAEAAELDRRAIEQLGIPSRALMQRAGAAAAAHVMEQAAQWLAGGVVVYCGAGNNGGDGWVIARSLAAAGVSVRVDEVVPAKSEDCMKERALALPLVRLSQEYDGEQVAVDAILGTGASGSMRGEVANGVARLEHAAARGAFVAAIDLPSGLDATSGAANGAVPAALTVTFGTIKRGLLHARGLAGRIVLVDIGLPAHFPADGEESAVMESATARGAAQAKQHRPSPSREADSRHTSGRNIPRLANSALVRLAAPPPEARAHKGTRRKVAILGGTRGMAGAVVLATRAAVASGVGMVRAVVSEDGLSTLQSQAPTAMCITWPLGDADMEEFITSWADALVIGPGLGRSDDASELVHNVLRRSRLPVVVDADALNVFEGRAHDLRDLLDGRPAILTPHPAEFARLAGGSVDDVLADPYEGARSLAATIGAVVLLKGVPSVIAAPDGRCVVTATGTPLLATAGSGDVLSGIVGTLLAQNPKFALEAASAAAWAHGRAAEFAGRSGVRGVALESVTDALPDVWSEAPLPPSPVSLAVLPEPIRTGALTSGTFERPLPESEEAPENG